MRTMLFPEIPAVPKRDMVLMRLGYKKNTTELGSEQKDFLERAIKEGLSLCRPRGVMRRLGILEHCEDYIVLESGDKIFSKSLSKLLEKSDEVVLMAATVGEDVVERVRFEIEQGEAALGVVIDSVASQTADAAVGWIMDFTGKMVRREGKTVTKHRYSPGYGDLSLSNQKMLFELLDLQKLSMALTEKYMLVPEKSVTAIAGIERVENF